ncbi:hypothetical protein AYO38_03205 [bacterium SCGC AG-212-C10]|nr:hypothetical protein AYO38_03205 [bacterium SCGC AG-212-C10]
MSKAHIRAAIQADLPEILRVYNDAILTGVATWDEAPWSAERRLEWWRQHAADPASPVLVAEAPGAEGAQSFAGFAYLTRMSDKSGWRFTREDTIYLDPAFHGRGIGRELLGQLLAEAKTLGLRLIVASITSTNAASIALHASLGFETMGEMKNAGYKWDTWHSTTYMQKDLHG